MQLISIADVCKKFGVSDQTIRNWSNNKSFPAPFKVGSVLRWHRETIEEWLKEKQSLVRYVFHETNSGTAMFRIAKPNYRLTTEKGVLAVFKTSDDLWHTRDFRTQTVWRAGPDLLELSCEDWSVEEIAFGGLPRIATTSDDEEQAS